MTLITTCARKKKTKTRLTIYNPLTPFELSTGYKDGHQESKKESKKVQANHHN